MGKTEYVTITIPEQVLVKIYGSVIGQIAIIESESRYKQLLAGCRLREQGYRHYAEYLDPEISEQMESWCSGRSTYIKADEFDLYVKCASPHHFFGCKAFGHTVGEVYVVDGKTVITAVHNGRRMVIYKGVKNVFNDVTEGQRLDGFALISWELMLGDGGEYDRYRIRFLYEGISGFVTVTPDGDVVDAVYNLGKTVEARVDKIETVSPPL